MYTLRRPPPAPNSHGRIVYLPQFRGIGFADMLWAGAPAARTARPAELALHVLELMSAAIVASEQGRVVDLETTCERGRAAAGRPAREHVRRLTR